MNNQANDKKNNASRQKGFTLVELIVVLVILAILAAILVPMLLGYIDSAKEKQDLLNAKNCLTAAQAELTKLYATSSDKVEDGSVIPGAKKTNSTQDVLALRKNGDNRAQTDFADNVFKIADDHPFCFIIAMERVESGKVTHGNYTVIYALYMKDADSAPLYFDGSSWSRTNTRNAGVHKKIGNGNNQKNVTEFNGKEIPIQYYILADAGGKVPDQYWSDLSGDPNRKANAKNSRNIWTWLRFYVGAEDF